MRYEPGRKYRIGGFIDVRMQQKRLAASMEHYARWIAETKWWQVRKRMSLERALLEMIYVNLNMILEGLRNPTGDATIRDEQGGGNDDVNG